jgi:hypothetical protein
VCLLELEQYPAQFHSKLKKFPFDIANERDNLSLNKIILHLEVTKICHIESISLKFTVRRGEKVTRNHETIIFTFFLEERSTNLSQ